jgi:Uma2 family endonuclease
MVLIQHPTEIIYPDDDGNPMSDNTLQFHWIVTIQQNLETLFANNDNVFVAGNLLWYPIEGDNKTSLAPDAMAVFGRPKGYRGSYMQWKEANIAPQVVFEILSPSNRPMEMIRKLNFYDKHGVEEYYLYDPDSIELCGWLRQGDRLKSISTLDDWVSPRLQIRFDLSGEELQLYYPDGSPFTNLNEQRRYAEAERERAEAERERAEAERERAEAERERADRLAEKLRSLGLDPNDA